MRIFSFSIIWQSMKVELNKHSENINVLIIKRKNSKIYYCRGLLSCFVFEDFWKALIISQQESFPTGVKD